MRIRPNAPILLVFALLALTSCAGLTPPPVIPPIPAERIPAPPSSTVTLIWRPGHYVWDGTRYEWIIGEWVPRSGHGPLWQDGFWRRAPGVAGGWEWVPAHWL